MKKESDLSINCFQGFLTSPANNDSLDRGAHDVLCYMQRDHAALESSFHCSNKALKHLSNYGVEEAILLRETQAAITLAYAYLVGEDHEKAISLLGIAQKNLPQQVDIPEVLHKTLLRTHQAMKCTLAATLSLQQGGSVIVDELKIANSSILNACRAAIDAYIAESIAHNELCSIIKSS